MVLIDPRGCVADRSGHAGASPLGSCAGLTPSAAEADSPSQLLDQVVAVVLCEFESRDVVRAGCVVDVVVDVDESPPVCIACLIIEMESGVATVAWGQHRVASHGHGRQRTAFDSDEVERVELAIRLGQEPLEIAQPLEVVEQDGDAVEADGAGVSVASEQVRVVVCGRPGRDLKLKFQMNVADNSSTVAVNFPEFSQPAPD